MPEWQLDPEKASPLRANREAAMPARRPCPEIPLIAPGSQRRFVDPPAGISGNARSNPRYGWGRRHRAPPEKRVPAIPNIRPGREARQPRGMSAAQNATRAGTQLDANATPPVDATIDGSRHEQSAKDPPSGRRLSALEAQSRRIGSRDRSEFLPGRMTQHARRQARPKSRGLFGNMRRHNCSTRRCRAPAGHRGCASYGADTTTA
jgi:hypothetical protein